MGIRDDWEHMDEEMFLVKYGPYAAFFVVFVVLTIGFLLPFVQITWPVVFLAILFVAVPYLPLLKYLVFEGKEEVMGSLLDEAEETVEIPQGQTEDDVEERLSNVESALYSQMADDPQIALLRLRVEIEDALTEIAYERGLQTKEEFVQFHEVMRFLKDNDDALPPVLYEDVMQVHSVTNRAVQAGRVSSNNANRIIRVGLRVLERLYLESEMPVNPEAEEPAFPTKQRY